MVFRVLTPNTQYGKSSDGQQDSLDSLFQDNPDTLYKICSSIAKVILFYEKSSAGGGALYRLYSEIDRQFSI